MRVQLAVTCRRCDLVLLPDEDRYCSKCTAKVRHSILTVLFCMAATALLLGAKAFLG